MQNYVVILDMQLNPFDNQQRRFLCFIFIINLESKKANMPGLHIHLLLLPWAFFNVHKLQFWFFIMPVLASNVNK